MIPGMGGGLDPKKMQGIMKKMGINQEEVDAKRVFIEKEDGNIVVENPQVVKITMQGQSSFQVSGEIREEEAGVSEEDVGMVVEKTGKTREEAERALEETGGDIAEAIVKLTG
jgi:nascent polypeptide-associated complex subunit alpha